MATTTRPMKRVKIAVACQRCRVRKVRCDGARPTCLQCMIGQTDCSWPNENGVGGTSNGDNNNMFHRASSPPNLHHSSMHASRPSIDHLSADLSAHIPRSTPLTHAPLLSTDYGQNHIPITPLPFDPVPQHPTLPQTSPNSYSINSSTAPHVDDFNSLQWMMNQLDGGATNASAESAILASPSSSNTSADVGGHALSRSRMLATQEKLNNLTWKELYARVYGTYARYLIDISDVQEDILEDRLQLQLETNMSPSENPDSPFDHAALADAARALAIRFQGLNEGQEIQHDRVRNGINDAMRHVGSILRHPTHKGILAIGLLSWLLYEEDEARAAFSYCSTAVSQWTILPQALQTQDGVHSGAWVLYDLVGEMILRSGKETSQSWLDLHQKAFVPQDDSDDTSALISANIAVQNASVAIHQLVSAAAKEQGNHVQDMNGKSEIEKPTVQEISKFYAKLDIPFATLNTEQLSRLDAIEQQASQVYEALPASALFSVTNFTQHDQAGHGAVFLALHVKYEATMCYIYQMRAYSTSDERERLEAITTSASAARSLADDLVVAEAMAPWAIAANPSLDRYIFLGALSILISFKMATGSFAITQKPIRAEAHANNGQSTTGPSSTTTTNVTTQNTKMNSKSDSTKKRLLGNVLRQNFTACLHALKLLSRFCLASTSYLELLNTITTSETET